MDELGSSSRYHHDEYDEEEDDEDNEEQGGNKLFGFMFGNVDDSGDLDVDYLDEDAKEHLSALADKLGSSLTDIDLKPTTPADASEQDYAEKADDAVDYEDIDEQYEGPEIQATTEEDYLLPRKEYFSAEISLVSLDKRASVFDEENYDEDEDSPKEHMSVENISEPQTSLPEGKQLDLVSDQEKFFDDNLPSAELSEAADVYHLEDFSEEESEDLDEPSESKDETSLPVLYIEDGMAVLRFSEIFGIHEPVKKQERRDHHRCSTHKDKARTIDVTESIEVDEGMLLKSSFHVPHITGHICLSQYDIGKVKDISMEPPLVHPEDWRKDSCLSALPMKECMSMDDLPVGQILTSCPEFYPLDYQDWEDSIVWGNSPRVVHESSESSVISGVEADVSTNVEIDVGGVVLQDKEPEFQTGADEKEHNLYLQSYPVSVEAFGSREESEFADLRSLGRCYHPQVLRLDTRMEMQDSHSMEVRKDDGTGLCGSETLQRLTEISSQNKDLLDGSWVDHILWEPNATVPKPKLILDLQDDRMLFEIVDSKDSKQILSRARAMIITRTLKSCPRDSFDLPGHVGPPIGKFDISNDKYYPNRKTSQQLKSHAKKRAVHGIKIVHSAPALKLHTMKPKLSNKEIANFHRPKALWYPHDNETAGKEQGNPCTQGSMNIVVLSIGGKGIKLQVNAEEPVFSVKEKASKKLDYKPSESVKIFYSGKELEDDKSLFIQNVRPNSVLHLVRTKIHMWPRAQKLPGENKSLRPPAAFKKKSELSVKMGHVFLMEYCEERPLLLSNIGMAARIFTYYQKVTLGDQSASSLRNGHSILGNVLTLDPADKSPFLGDIRPGCSQMCLETNLYRAPIFPHKLPSTDYLLVRNAKGMLSLRRIDRIHAVGQQEPHMEVNSPGSKSLQTYLGNRLLAYIYREFHANEKPGYLPCVRATDVTSKFPSLAEPFIRKKLKHCADLQRGPHGQLYWRMRRNFHPPSEEELRRMVTPENVCCYESMQAGLYRLKHLGISRLTHPTNLSYAMDHLPNKAIMLAAASHIERELQITPWNLSSNFVACISQDRENIERLEITGVGDPSGRGLGFSYVRVSPKSSVSSAAAKKKVATARAGSTLTGTDADLRRISMDAARDILLQLGLKPEDIEKKGRWHRIALIRQLSSEQAASGVRVDMAALGKFARGQRMSFLQLQQQTREKCQEIWDRQVQSLSAADGDENESDTEANSDLDSFAGDLENLLDAEEGEDGVKGDHEPLMSDAESGRELKMRRQLSQAQVDEYREDIEAEAAEIRRLLYDDDNALRKKQKTKPTVKEVRLNMQLGLASHGAEIKKAKDIKHIARAMQPESSFPSKEIAVVKPVEGESFLAKSNFTPEKGKKEMGKKEIIHTGVMRKKSKVIGDVIKMKEKKHIDKPVREGFVCGACGLAGHMRTNKNCPKYGEELDAQVETSESRNVLKQPALVDATGQLPKTPTKKVSPMPATKFPIKETLEQAQSSIKPQAKILPLKLKPVPADNQSSDNQVTRADSEIGTKSVPKFKKIIIPSKQISEDIQREVQKPSVVIRLPLEVDRDQPRKKIIIKQARSISNVEQVRHAVEDGNRKSKKIVELSSLDKHGKQGNVYFSEEQAKWTTMEERRLWEEEDKRNRERIIEESRRYYKEESVQEGKRKLFEMRSYEETVHWNSEEQQRASKKKKKKKKHDFKDEYLAEYKSTRSDRRIPDRAAKRRPVVDLGRYSAEHGVPTKRRRGGEVVLSNILEGIVDSLRDAHEVSYLFQKPVSKKEAPDYLDIIKNPMDLSSIREKVRRMEYKNREDFRHDVWQITYNAHAYNDGRNPSIPPLADQLLELCDFLLDENDTLLTDAEEGIQM